MNSWKNLWKFWNGPLCRNKSGPFPLLNVAAYWHSSNTEACAKKLPQIVANNIDNRGMGIGLRIYVRCCRSYGISGQLFGLNSSFLINRGLRVVLDGESSQEHPVNTGVCQSSILGPTLFLLYINDLSDDVICDIAIYADNATLYSKCD